MIQTVMYHHCRYSSDEEENESKDQEPKDEKDEKQNTKVDETTGAVTTLKPNYMRLKTALTSAMVRCVLLVS